MKRSLGLFVVAVIFFVSGVAGQASAQWPGQNQGTPRDGACFYLDGGYNNQSFCLNAGQSMNRLPSGFNDQITSIRVLGGATVTVYEDNDFRGPSESFDRSQNDLRSVRKRDDSSRVWSDRISSVRVEFAQGGDRADQGDYRGEGRGPVWGRGAQPRQGACFFRDTSFQGDYFCMARGESFRALPSGFNDRISSIRVFRGTRVSVFQDNDFRGASETFARSQNDLRSVRKRDDRSRMWTDRISSVRVD
jgi:hypothetical protein